MDAKSKLSATGEALFDYLSVKDIANFIVTSTIERDYLVNILLAKYGDWLIDARPYLKRLSSNHDNIAKDSPIPQYITPDYERIKRRPLYVLINLKHLTKLLTKLLQQDALMGNYASSTKHLLTLCQELLQNLSQAKQRKQQVKDTMLIMGLFYFLEQLDQSPQAAQHLNTLITQDPVLCTLMIYTPQYLSCPSDISENEHFKSACKLLSPDELFAEDLQAYWYYSYDRTKPLGQPSQILSQDNFTLLMKQLSNCPGATYSLMWQLTTLLLSDLECLQIRWREYMDNVSVVMPPEPEHTAWLANAPPNWTTFISSTQREGLLYYDPLFIGDHKLCPLWEFKAELENNHELRTVLLQYRDSLQRLLMGDDKVCNFSEFMELLNTLNQRMPGKVNPFWRSDCTEIAHIFLKEPERFINLFANPNPACPRSEFTKILRRFPPAKRAEIAMLILALFGNHHPVCTWSEFKNIVNNNLHRTRVLLHTLHRFAHLIGDDGQQFTIAELKRALDADKIHKRLINTYTERQFIDLMHYYNNNTVGQWCKSLMTTVRLSYTVAYHNNFSTLSSHPFFAGPQRICYWWEFGAIVKDNYPLIDILFNSEQGVRLLCGGPRKICSLSQLVSLLNQCAPAYKTQYSRDHVAQAKLLLLKTRAMHYLFQFNTNPCPWEQFVQLVNGSIKTANALLRHWHGTTSLVNDNNSIWTWEQLAQLVNGNVEMVKILARSSETIIQFFGGLSPILTFAEFTDAIDYFTALNANVSATQIMKAFVESSGDAARNLAVILRNHRHQLTTIISGQDTLCPAADFLILNQRNFRKANFLLENQENFHHLSKWFTIEWFIETPTPEDTLAMSDQEVVAKEQSPLYDLCEVIWEFLSCILYWLKKSLLSILNHLVNAIVGLCSSEEDYRTLDIVLNNLP